MDTFFGAEKINVTQLKSLFNTTPDLLKWAAPIFVVLILAEYIVAHYQNKKYYTRNDTIGTIGTGVGNALIGIAIKTGLFYLLVWVYNLVPWRMEFSWWALIPCFIFFDFFSYWSHYVSHHQRFWWATHVVHHSSENYNLSVSFRLSWVEYLKMIFLLPVSLIGFHPLIILIIHQVTVLYQFWVHTEYIKKLHPSIENIFVTPSSHRVHHASQPKYMNKNFGSALIIWDKLFGTYQEEDEKPVFGITHNIKSKTNPLYINFHEFAEIVKDIKKENTLKKKLFYIFGDPIKIAEERKNL